MVIVEDLELECLIIWDTQVQSCSALVKVKTIVLKDISGGSCLYLGIYWPLGIAEGFVDRAKIVI